MASIDGYDRVPVAEIEAEVETWLERHDPYSKADLNAVDSRFMRSVGRPARMGTDFETTGGMTEKNPHMRVATPAEFGVFAYEEDTVLIELGEDVTCGELSGYPAGDHRWVPVLFCFDGPVERAREQMELVLVTLQGVTDGDLAL